MPIVASADRSGAGEVAPLLHRALRAVGLARLAEAVLLAATALTCVLAAAALSGGTLSRPATWGVALLCASLVALTWWLEKRPRPARLAARVDSKLGLGGSLLTAYEAEQTPPERRSPLARLLSAGLLRRISERQVLAAALPRSLPFAALPFLGAGLLAIVLEGGEPERAVPWLGELSGPLVVELSQARGLLNSGQDRAGELSPAAAEEARHLARQALASAEALDRALAGGQDDAQRLALQTRRLQERLGELGRLLPPGSSAGVAADRARALTDAMAMALGLPSLPARDRESAEAGGGAGGGGEAESEAGRDGSGALASDRGGSAGDGEQAADHGTGAAATLPSADRGVAPATPEAAVGGRWWPGHLDGIVRRWHDAGAAAHQAGDDSSAPLLDN
ncbi:MAG: hypothetical protein CMK00_01350 [Planctomycetes bacterium]|nr:hypothetical protein [Planctomycetota bacterium]